MKKLDFKGKTIEEICEILEGGININVFEASDIMNAIERDIYLKKKDGFMPNSMWTEMMAQLEGLFEFIESEDGNISTKDVIYVDFSKSQKPKIKELKKKLSQVKNDIVKLEKRAERVSKLEQEIANASREVEKYAKQATRKKNAIKDITDATKLEKAENELTKIEKALKNARAKKKKFESDLKYKNDAIGDINSRLEYKNEQVKSLEADIENAKALKKSNVVDALTDEVSDNERSIELLKKDLYEGFELKRTEYSDSLKKDLSKIDRQIAKATDEKVIAELKAKKSQMLIDKSDEITVYLDKYRVTMQSSSKSRLNKSIFIRDEIINTKTGEVIKTGALEAIEDKMTMGLSKILHSTPDKIIPAVEYEAYSTLSQSSIVDGFVEIKGDNILVVKDVDCAVKTKGIIGRQNKDATDILLEKIEDYADKNTLWDGMSLLDKSLFKNDHDMILLRQNYFKSAAFKCNLQDYIKSQCAKLGLDYENGFVTDAYGRKVKISDIKMITTNNSTKFDKFAKEMFGDVEDAERKMYEHWLDCLEKDWNSLFSVVKFDKSSKFNGGKLVRGSYQMFNTIPFGDDIEESMKKIVKVTQDYVEELRTNASAFKDYLENVANNEKADWLLGMMNANADIINSKEFQAERNAICNSILDNAKKGKLMVQGNNMTLCSNPVELVKYALNSPDIVVKDGKLVKELTKNSFGEDIDVIKVYTNRFTEGEDLVFMRSPHSSASGICVGKNVKNDEIEELFGKELGDNILIINSANHASQSALNGADFDSDFVLTTNNEELVRLAKKNWGKEYIPVNEVGKEKAQYTIMDKAKKDLALGDNTIGEIVNKGQIAKSQLDHIKRNKDFYIKKFGSIEEYERQLEGIQNIIDSLTIASNISIDSAKRKYDLNMREYLKNIDKSEFWLRDEDGKVLKPNFFKSISQNKDLNTIKMDCNQDLVADYIIKPNKLKGDIDIVDLFEDFNTKRVNNKQIDKILDLVETSNKKIKALRIQINQMEDNDDLYKLIDKEKASLVRELKKIKLNDDTYKCIMNKVYTDKRYSSSKSLMLDSLMKYNTDKFIGSFKKGASIPSQEEMMKVSEEQVKAYLESNQPLVKDINNAHDELYKSIKKDLEPIKNNYANGVINLEEATGQINKLITDSCKDLRILVTNKMTEHFGATIEFGYYSNLFNSSKSIGLGISFDMIPTRTLEAILDTPFAGSKYDKRLYKNIDGVLADELKNTLYKGIEEGKSVWNMAQEVRKLTDYSKKSCERIVRTETNNFYNEGTKRAYQELGIEKYVYLATLDTRTSKICRELDMKVFDLNDAEVGKNYPPMHINCRSTTISYVDDETLATLTRRARNSEGRSILIEKGITYEEWYKEYIKK